MGHTRVFFSVSPTMLCCCNVCCCRNNKKFGAMFALAFGLILTLIPIYGGTGLPPKGNDWDEGYCMEPTNKAKCGKFDPKMFKKITCEDGSACFTPLAEYNTGLVLTLNIIAFLSAAFGVLMTFGCGPCLKIQNCLGSKGKLLVFVAGIVFFICTLLAVLLSLTAIPLLVAFYAMGGNASCPASWSLCQWWGSAAILGLGSVIAFLLAGFPVLIATCYYWRATNDVVEPEEK